MSINVWVHFWILCPFLSLYLSIIILISHCLDYYSFIIRHDTNPTTLLFIKQNNKQQLFICSLVCGLARGQPTWLDSSLPLYISCGSKQFRSLLCFHSGAQNEEAATWVEDSYGDESARIQTPKCTSTLWKKKKKGLYF